MGEKAWGAGRDPKTLGLFRGGCRDAGAAKTGTTEGPRGPMTDTSARLEARRPGRKLECSKNAGGIPKLARPSGVSRPLKAEKGGESVAGASRVGQAEPTPHGPLPPARRPRAAAPWPATCRRNDPPPALHPSCRPLATLRNLSSAHASRALRSLRSRPVQPL